ncbi:MAG: hypothetical protein U0575_13000 [Phycisphaerales bacterium]
MRTVHRLTFVPLVLVVACEHPPAATEPTDGAGSAAEQASASTLISKPGGLPGGSATPKNGDVVISTGVPVSIDTQAVEPDAPLGALALQSSGTVRFSGTLPVTYRVEFRAPPGHEAECPAPITRVATSPIDFFTVSLRKAPSVAQRYVIDVSVTVLDGTNAGKTLHSPVGMIVFPDKPAPSGASGAVD